MPSNFSALSNVTTQATALSNLILVTPQATIGYQPQNAPNPDGSISVKPPRPAMMFHYEGEQTATLDSDITDHFVEDNTAIQDQIALRPEVITTHGFIGELNDLAPLGLQTAKALASKLVPVTGYLPGLSETALIAYNNAAQAYAVAANTANAAIASWSSITGTGGENVIGTNGLQEKPGSNLTQTKQQIAFQQFYGYWKSRTLFTVQTPWAVFENMVIKTLRAIQDAETRMITDFEISFKMMRFANTLSFQFGTLSSSALDRAFNQGEPSTDLGVGQTGADAPFNQSTIESGPPPEDL